MLSVDRPSDEPHQSHDVQGTSKPQTQSGLWSGTAAGSRGPLGHLSDEELNSLSFTELRDKLLGFDPLNSALVNKVSSTSCVFL